MRYMLYTKTILKRFICVFLLCMLLFVVISYVGAVNWRGFQKSQNSYSSRYRGYAIGIDGNDDASTDTVLYVHNVKSTEQKHGPVVALNNVRYMQQRGRAVKIKKNKCSKVLPLNARFDCHPDPWTPTSQKVCIQRGCCWEPVDKEAHNVNGSISVPFCFFPDGYDGYVVSKQENHSFGFSVTLVRTTNSGWPHDVKKLQMDVIFEERTRLHFKIYDPAQKRYEVPITTPPSGRKDIYLDYGLALTPSPHFGFTVFRKSTGATIFDTVMTQAPLIFSDQFIQISTRTGTGIIYGLGEHRSRLLHNNTWQQLSFWARDNPPMTGRNLYGVHPFYMGIEEDGQAYGVFLLNSNAMEVDLQPMPALTFRTTGGILDFYIFTGPSPDQVVQQYMDVIGRPFMPPYWALGFHLCRFGYKTSKELKDVINRTRAIGLPYDVQWTDLDYMGLRRDWTYNKTAFADLPSMVQDLHSHGQKYIVIVDPGIAVVNPDYYAPYEEGLKDGIFMRNASGQLLISKVWPGATVYPDFTHPKAADWWYRMAKQFHDQIPFDGLWTDMNEPSNFVSGSMSGCTNNTLDNPPFVPGVYSGRLYDLTACPSASQHLSSHYNLHNLYGHTEVVATHSALKKILNKRSIVISRSTFPSTGHYGGHWSGDVFSTWEDLHYSIPVMLNFQMYGIPLVGADICGFNGNTTEELCVRWMQLGAFYPFSRNHNSNDCKDQDPAVFSKSAQQAMIRALRIRYLLLPYLYTLFYESHVFGSAVARPLFFQYPKDSNTYALDTQFLWGDSLLISPALKQGQKVVEAYFPVDLWYDLQSGKLVQGRGKEESLPTPLNHTNVHLRGGAVVPCQQPNTTTTDSRKNPLGLMVALNSSGLASGKLYWDDGETLNASSHDYTLLQFNAEKNVVRSRVLERRGPAITLDRVIVFGVATKPISAKVNNVTARVQYYSDKQVLVINGFSVSLLNSVTVIWQEALVHQAPIDDDDKVGPETKHFLFDFLGMG